MATRDTKKNGKRNRNPRIGLALGGGAARGWAHLGVLQALEEAGIRPVCVAGTSIGSLVGAAWASGGLTDLRAAVEGLDRRTLATFLNVAVPASRRLDGPWIESLMRRFVRAESIADLSVPFAAVATDLFTAREVVIREGDPIAAIRASCGVPGLFRPVVRDGHLLIDGGMVNPVPVNVARALGADFVIAVDISHRVVEDSPYLPRPAEVDDAESGSVFPAWMNRLLTASGLPFRPRHPNGPAMPGFRELLMSSVAVGEVTIGDLRLKVDPPDILLRPKVGHIRFLDFTHGTEAIQAGYEVTVEALAQAGLARPAPAVEVPAALTA